MMTCNSSDRLNRISKSSIHFLLLLLVMLFGDQVSYHLKASDDALPKVRVVTEGLKPLVYTNPDSDEIQGLAANMVKDILHLSGISYSMEMLPWTRAYYIAKNDPNVLIFMIARSESREDQFIWLHHYITLNFYLYALENRKTELSSPGTDYKSARIGVIRNDFTHTELKKKGFTNLIAVEDDDSLSQMLIRGRIDFVCSSGFGMQHFELGKLLNSSGIYEAAPLPLRSIPIYFALSQNTDPKIVSKLKQTIAEMDNIEQYQLPDYKKQHHDATGRR